MKSLPVWMVSQRRRQLGDASSAARSPIYFSFPAPSLRHCDVANPSRRALLALFSRHSPSRGRSESPPDTSGKLKHSPQGLLGSERSLRTPQRQSGLSSPARAAATETAPPCSALLSCLQGAHGGSRCNSALQ